MIDVVILALVFLVVGLSLPTIIHLSSLLKNDSPLRTTTPMIANHGD